MQAASATVLEPCAFGGMKYKKKQFRVDSPTPEFHAAVKIKAALEGKTIASLILNFLTNYIK